MPFVPQGSNSDGSDTNRVRVPRHSDNNYFSFYFAQPPGSGGWTLYHVIDEKGKATFDEHGDPIIEWLPNLRRQKMQPGVHGIKGVKEGAALDLQPRLDRLRNQGWRLIPRGIPCVGFGVPLPKGYIVRYDAAGAKDRQLYSDAWTRPVITGTGKDASVRWESDQRGWLLFLRSLVEFGVVPLPDENVMRERIDVMNLRTTRHNDRMHIESVKSRVDLTTRIVNVANDIIDDVASGKTHHSLVGAKDYIRLPGSLNVAGMKRKYLVTAGVEAAPVFVDDENATDNETGDDDE